MSMVKKSITVTDKQEAWIKAQINSGDYGNDSEVIRDLIRLKQAKDAEILAIRAALIEAEQSGFSDKTAEQIRQDAKTRLRANSDLSA